MGFLANIFGSRSKSSGEASTLTASSSNIMVGIEDLMGDGDLSEIAKLNPWVAASIRYISQNSVRPILKLRSRSTKDDVKDDILNVLNQPNKFQSYQDWLSFNVNNYLIYGRCLNEKITVGSKVKGFMPIPSPNVTIEVLKDGSDYYYKVYKNGKTVKLLRENTVDWRDTTYTNSLVDTIGKVESLIYQATLSTDVDKYNHNFLKNGAVPSGILSVEHKLTKAELDDLREKWDDIHSGKNKVGKTALLNGKTTYQGLGTSNKEMGYEKLKEITRQEILAIMQVPPVILGLTDSVNRSNAEAQMYLFWTDVMIPLMDGFANKLTQTLLRDTSYEFYFDYTNIDELNQDLETKLRTALYARQLGIPVEHIIESMELPFDASELENQTDNIAEDDSTNQDNDNKSRKDFSQLINNMLKAKK